LMRYLYRCGVAFDSATHFPGHMKVRARSKSK
jgi:hypothetical protein